MAQVSAGSFTQVHEPPELPEYLKKVYDLKPIVGAPSDEEVKGIHAVIRVANTVSQAPGMFNPDLSMHLAQHLFDVQMARFQDRYPCIFIKNTVYTPPALPSHVSVTLEPVVGAPSDQEAQDVQAAVRAYEHFSSVPSMFDPNISMELSQHLCNIHIARYMQRVALGQPGVQHVQSRRRDGESTRPSGSTGRVGEPIESARVILDGEAPATPVTFTGGVESQQHSSQTSGTIAGNPIDPSLVSDSNKLLKEIRDTMQNVNRVLISTQRISAKGARASHSNASYNASVGQYEMINEKGERPKDYGLPSVTQDHVNRWHLESLNDEQLAQYLQFYGIGSDLVQSGEVPVLKADKRSDAEGALLNYLS